jgi:hypothetical protein
MISDLYALRHPGRQSPRLRLSIGDIGEQSPLAGDPLEVMGSAVSKTRPEVSETERVISDTRISSAPGHRHDARRFVHGHTANIRAHQLHLTDMDAGTNLQAFSVRRSADGGSAAQSLCRTVEGRQQPVAGGLDLAAAEPLQLRTCRLEVH